MKIKIDDACAPETKLFMKAVFTKLKDISEPCDIGSLNMLMLSYDMYIKASKDLLKDGPILSDRQGNKKINPAVSLTKSYWTQVATFMREMGLTIKSREKIKSLTPEVDPENDLLGFLNSKK